MTRFLSGLLGGALIIALTLPLAGCPCGFDCSDDDEQVSGPALLDLGLSADVFTDAKAVVLTIDSITLSGSGSVDDVTIDTFTIDALGLSNADSVQLDLLDYPALNQLLLVTAQEIDSGNYSSLTLTVLDGDVNFSYVLDSEDAQSELNVSNSKLTVSGISLNSGSAAFTITFSLVQDLQARDSQGDYLLTTTVTRVNDNAVSGGISGRLASDLFDTVSPCDEKTDPEQGNRLYLYKGLEDTQQGADAFTTSSNNDIPDNSVAPYAVSAPIENSLNNSWEYAFGFLAEGAYSLRFSCDAETDDAVDYDGLSIPLPEGQVYSIELAESEAATCDIEDDASCS